MFADYITMIKIVRIPLVFLFVIISSYANAAELHNSRVANDASYADELKDLKKRISSLEKAVAQLLEQQKNNAAPTPAAGSVSEGSLTKTTNNMAETASLVSPEKTEYDLALAALKHGDLRAAETQFADFARKYPKGELRENALFWYAEVFFRTSDFNQSAIHFLKCYKEYPKGIKAADALLKLGLSLGEMGKNKEACSILHKLDTEFPSRQESNKKRSLEAKAKFKCK